MCALIKIKTNLTMQRTKVTPTAGTFTGVSDDEDASLVISVHA